MAVLGAYVLPHPPVLLPEIGRGEEGKLLRTQEAYAQAAKEIVQLQPETVVIVSPHSVCYRDYFHISPGNGAQGDFAVFGAPGLSVTADYDTALVAALTEQTSAKGLAAGTDGQRQRELDHGTMIPLYHLQQAGYQGKIVRIGLSALSYGDHFSLGQCITQAAARLDRRVVVIASGDLSHYLLEEGPYGYRPEGPEYDRQVTAALAQGKLSLLMDFSAHLCSEAGECGHRAFVIMAGCLDGILLESQLLSYEGPFGVGYAVASFQDAYTALARQALALYVKRKEVLSVSSDLPEEIGSRQAGVFVSLKKDGALRGCIGTIQGVQEHLGREIIENAIAAASRDPRFAPVAPHELERITCTVDVLSEAEPVTDFNMLDVQRYGIIVTQGGRRGLLLPHLEGVDTVQEQLAIALQKAGIMNGPYQLERFEVVRHF